MDVSVSYSSKILAIGMILGEKIERKVYLHQAEFTSAEFYIRYTTTD